jgi:hypothetical protein
MQSIAPTAEYAVPVFHCSGVLGQVVMLRNRYIDDLVGVDQRGKNRPLVKQLALHARGAVAMVCGQHHLRAERICSLHNARSLKAARRFVAGSVGDNDAFGTRIERKFDHRRNHLRIAVGGVDRHSIPTNVRLHDHHVAAANEALHSAHRSHRTLDQVGCHDALTFGIWHAARDRKLRGRIGRASAFV